MSVRPWLLLLVLFAPQSVAAARHVIVFRAPGFPTTDAPAIPDATLDEALRGFVVQMLADLSTLQQSKDAVLDARSGCGDARAESGTSGSRTHSATGDADDHDR